MTGPEEDAQDHVLLAVLVAALACCIAGFLLHFVGADTRRHAQRQPCGTGSLQHAGGGGQELALVAAPGSPTGSAVAHAGMQQGTGPPERAMQQEHELGMQRGEQDGGFAQHAEAMQQLLQQFFDSSDLLSDWVDDGGLASLAALLPPLCDGILHGPDAQHAQLTMQVSWLLLQLSHAPHPTRRALREQLPMALLRRFIAAATSSHLLPHSVQAATLRNCCWALCSLCDVSWTLHQGASASVSGYGEGEGGGAVAAAAAAAPDAAPGPSSQALASSTLAVVDHGRQSEGEAQEVLELGLWFGRAVAACGLLNVLQPSLRGEHGLDAAGHAAALLASLALLEDADGALAADAQRALLAPGVPALLCSLLGPPGGGGGHRHERARTLLLHYLHHMLQRHPGRLAWQLMYDHAVYDVLGALPGQLAGQLAYSLLTQPGQDAMAALEQQFCVDVPVALAHLTASEHANRVVQVAGVGGAGAGAAADDAAAGGDGGAAGAGGGLAAAAQQQPAASTTRSLSLHALACRALLSGERLDELVNACFDELTEAQQEQEQEQEDGLPASALGEEHGQNQRRRKQGWQQGMRHPDGDWGADDAAVDELPWVTDTVEALTLLLAHLQKLDVQLAQFRAIYGVGVEDMSVHSSEVDRRGGSKDGSVGGWDAGLGGTAQQQQQQRRWTLQRRSVSSNDSVLRQQLQQGGVPPQPRGPRRGTSSSESLPKQQSQQQQQQQQGVLAAVGGADSCLYRFAATNKALLQVQPLAEEEAGWEEEEAGQQAAHVDGTAPPGGNAAEQEDTFEEAAEARSGAWAVCRGGWSQPHIGGSAAGGAVAAAAGTSLSAIACSGAGGGSALAALSADLPAALPAPGRPCEQQQQQGPPVSGAAGRSASGPLAVDQVWSQLYSASASADGPPPDEPPTALSSQHASGGTWSEAGTLDTRGSGRPSPESDQGSVPRAGVAPAFLGAAAPGASSPADSVGAGMTPPRPPASEQAAGPSLSDPRSGAVVLEYGPHSVTLSRAQYQSVRKLSGLLRSWILRSSSQREVQKVLRVPFFDDEANCLAVRALVAAAAATPLHGGGAGAAARSGPAGAAAGAGIGGTGGMGAGRTLEGTVAREHAALIWQAADYYQVDVLKEHCEDLLIEALTTRLAEAQGTAEAQAAGSGGDGSGGSSAGGGSGGGGTDGSGGSGGGQMHAGGSSDDGTLASAGPSRGVAPRGDTAPAPGQQLQGQQLVGQPAPPQPAPPQPDLLELLRLGAAPVAGGGAAAAGGGGVPRWGDTLMTVQVVDETAAAASAAGPSSGVAGPGGLAAAAAALPALPAPGADAPGDGSLPAPPLPDAACAAVASALCDVLDLLSRYQHSSPRLSHLLSAWLMRHMRALLGSRPLVALLAAHRADVAPCVSALVRDRLVCIVMLSDSLAEEWM